MQAQKDDIVALGGGPEGTEGSKPLFVLYKGGSEVGRVEGSNADKIVKMIQSKI